VALPGPIRVDLSDEERELVFNAVKSSSSLSPREKRVLSEPGALTLELDLLGWFAFMGALEEGAKKARSLRDGRTLLLLRERFDEALHVVLPMDEDAEFQVVHLGEMDFPLSDGRVDEWVVRTNDLIAQHWLDEVGPMRLNPDLALDDLRDVPFLANCRRLLSTLRDRGPVKTTPAGNLPRDVVRQVLDEWHDELGELRYLRDYRKVINEEDVRSLRVARTVCSIAKLMRKYRGAFQVTRAGRELLRDEVAGDLYRLLFVTFFRRFNIGWLDRLPEDLDMVQGCAAVSLAILGVSDAEWRSTADWAEKLLPPAAVNTLVELGEARLVPLTAELRLLRPLSRFGLLEKRGVPTDAPYTREREYRKSPLFDRFIGFDPDILRLARPACEESRRPQPEVRQTEFFDGPPRSRYS